MSLLHRGRASVAAGGYSLAFSYRGVMRVLVVRAALAAVLLPASVGAQTLSLTESQALARLSDESPRVRAARAAVDVARADVLDAGRWPNPRVTFNRETVSGIAETYLTVAQALPVTGRR